MDNILTLHQGHFIVCVVLCFCSLVSCQDICTNTWITYENANVPGGSYVSNVVLVKKCQERCLAVPGCTGIDFDGASRCWLIRNGGAPKDDATKRVTHYDVRKNVTACTSDCPDGKAITWKQTNNSHIAEGASLSVVTFDECLMTCRDDVTCSSFDWNSASTTDTCWIVSNSNANPLQAMPGVRNFKKDCYYGGVKIVTPALIPIGEQAGSQAPTGATTPSGDGFVKDTVIGDYVSGEVFTIKPAYIVLIGMGLGCIILVVIAILVICIYPLKGARKLQKFSIRKLKTTKTSKNKKMRKESGELHTRRPKAFGDGEDEVIGMHTAKTSLHDSTYDARKSYNNEKKHIDSMYSETKIRDSYNDETKKIRDSYDTKTRDSYADTKPAYHHNHNGTLDHNPLPAYTAHHDDHIDNIAHQRHSLDMDSPGGRNSPMHLIEDKYGEAKHSNYDRIDDEIHDVMDNPTFKKDEDYD